MPPISQYLHINPTTQDPNPPMLPIFSSRRKQQPQQQVLSMQTPTVLMPLLSSGAGLHRRSVWSDAQYHNGTSNLLNRLNLPAPTRRTVMQVFGDGVPGAVGKGRCALRSGLEVARVNGARKIRQGFSGGAVRELCAGRLARCSIYYRSCI